MDEIGYLFSSSKDNADLVSKCVQQGFFDVLGNQRGVCLGNLKEHVAGIEDRFDILKPAGLERLAQLRHIDLPVPADIDPA